MWLYVNETTGENVTESESLTNAPPPADNAKSEVTVKSLSPIPSGGLYPAVVRRSAPFPTMRGRTGSLTSPKA